MTKKICTIFLFFRSADSPFIPITDSPASTLDLKSPLNENNFPLNIPSSGPPDNNEQVLHDHRKEELPKNIITNKPSTNNAERKKERKHSLAALQNTLDSILEVSENGSSSTRKDDSSMMSSLVTSDDENSNEESDIDDSTVSQKNFVQFHGKRGRSLKSCDGQLGSMKICLNIFSKKPFCTVVFLDPGYFHSSYKGPLMI